MNLSFTSVSVHSERDADMTDASELQEEGEESEPCSSDDVEDGAEMGARAGGVRGGNRCNILGSHTASRQTMIAELLPCVREWYRRFLAKINATCFSVCVKLHFVDTMAFWFSQVRGVAALE